MSLLYKIHLKSPKKNNAEIYQNTCSIPVIYCHTKRPDIECHFQFIDLCCESDFAWFLIISRWQFTVKRYSCFQPLLLIVLKINCAHLFEIISEIIFKWFKTIVYEFVLNSKADVKSIKILIRSSFCVFQFNM